MKHPLNNTWAEFPDRDSNVGRHPNAAHVLTVGTGPVSKHRFVAATADGVDAASKLLVDHLAVATEYAHGVTADAEDVTAGKDVTVQTALGTTCLLEVDSNYNAKVNLTSDAAGLGTAAAAGNFVSAVTLRGSATGGGFVEVMLVREIQP